MAVDGGKIISHLELDTGRYTSAMAAAQAQAKRFADENATVGTKLQATLGIMSNVGRLATGAITLPVVGMAAAGGKAAIEFESAFAGVRKTVDATEKQYAVLNKSILEMGRVVPKTHSELAGIMESGGQLGVAQDKLEKFTRVIADLDVATNLTGEAGASMLAQYANVKQMDLDNIDRLGSVIVDLGNNTATTELDIVNMAQRLSGAAAILKLTDAQTMGLAATMSSLGINAEAGGSAMSRILSKMMQAVKGGGDELKIYAKTANMSADAFAAAFGADPLTALIAFIGGLNEINEAGGNVYETLEEVELGDIRITDSLLRMSGAQGQLEKNIALANKAWAENTALTKEAEQRYGTTESKIKLAQNSIREAGISIGNAFLPVIGDAAEGVADLANRFADLDQQQQRQIITGAGIAAGIGPAMLLLKGVIGLLSGPGGLVAGAALGVLAIAGVQTAVRETSFARLGEELGDIKLSAEEVKKVVEAGFGAPLIDFSKLESARGEADAAKQSFIDLQAQLEKDVYLARMGVETLTPAEIDAQVGALVTSAQTYLAKEENAARMTIIAYFGEGTGEANSMLVGLDAAMSPLKAQMEAKGKELSDALKGAIADGHIDAEDEKVIVNLQNEIAEIAARGAMMKSQSERDVMIAKAQHEGLSIESIREGNRQLEEYRKTLLRDYTAERDLMMTIAANQKNMGVISAEEYGLQNKAIFARYGNLQADVDMGALDTFWEMFGRQINNAFVDKFRQAQDILNTPGFDLYGNDQESNANRDLIKNASNEASALLGELGWLFSTLSEMKGKLGDDMPAQYQSMLEVFGQLKALADQDWETVKTQTPTDSLEVDAAMEAAQKKAEEGMQKVVTTTKDKGKEAGKTAVQAVNQGAQEEEVHIEDTLTKPLEAVPGAYSDTGREAGTGIVNEANAAAASVEVTVDDSIAQPLASLPGTLAGIGAQAGADLARSVADQAPAAFAAGDKLGQAVERGAKKGLAIASPSKRMQKVAEISTWSLNERLEAGMPATYKAGQGVGDTLARGAEKGYKDAVLAGRQERPAANPLGGMTYIPGDVWTAMDQVPTKAPTTTKPRGGGGGGGSAGGGTDYAPPPPDYSWAIQQTLAKVDAERQRMTGVVAGYDAERARLLDMAGPWRAYYDQSAIDKQVQAIQDKYQAMMDAEQKGFDALSEGERQARSQAHSQLMQQLRQNQQDEVNAVRQNHDLQRRLATDWLTAQADLMTEQFNQKQEAARAEDYADNVADLEKRIRQTRSARERRELTEELERMRRDEALRQDQLALQSAMQGFAALKNAVNQGVIGLGDLTGDRTLPASAFGAGLKHVQGVTADQLESVLTAIADRQAQQSGNTYTIDLTGAVIRDDSDIDRIVAAFEERNRSIQRDMSTWR